MDNQIVKKYVIWVVVACILVTGLVWSTSIVAGTIAKKNSSDNVITVTGSAKKQIKSDFVIWYGDFSAQFPTLSAAFDKLKTDKVKVHDYLISKGIKESEIQFKTITTQTVYKQDINNNPTNIIDSYKLTQSVQVQSHDISKVSKISLDSSNLINAGIEFNSNAPQYIYTKLADMKISMLGAATKDTKKRAEEIAKNTGVKVGNLISSRMGVFQITPLYSTDTSDDGISDTSTIDKEITAVMSCDFEIKNK